MLILITWAQWGFQDALSPLMEEFLYFHDFLILILCLIFTSTIWILLKTTIHNGISKSLTSRHNLGECLWTIYPACVLLQIGVPSLTLVYILHETTISSQVLSKAIDHSSIGLVSIQIGGLNPPLLDIIIIQSQLLRRLLGAYDY